MEDYLLCNDCSAGSKFVRERFSDNSPAMFAVIGKAA